MLPLPELDFRRTPVVLTITAVAAALEVACQVRDPLREVLYTGDRLGLLSPVWSGEIWRPLTTSLLHGSLLHAAFNCYWMLVFGGTLERRFGSWRLLLLVVLLAYGSMMPQFVFSNRDISELDAQQAVVGLSGILYGLFGFLLIGRRHEQVLYEACNDATAMLMGAWFVFCIVAEQFKLMPVANIAHAAGLVFGVLYGCAVFERSRRWLWRSLAATATILVLTTLIYVPGNELFKQHRLQESRIRQYEELRQSLLQGAE
jgi:membrane associated rhomboid family serine protease